MEDLEAYDTADLEAMKWSTENHKDLNRLTRIYKLLE